MKRAISLLLILTAVAQAQTFDPARKLATGTIAHAGYAIGDIDKKGIFEARTQMTFWGEDTIELFMPGVSGDVATLGKRVVMTWVGRGSMEWVEDGASLRWKFKFANKPPTNKYVIKYGGNWKDFDFHYQAPWANTTQFMRGREAWIWHYDAEGNYEERRREIDGSYAVYHKWKKDHVAGSTNYRTGKAFHIPVPKATDARGKIAWCILEISNGLSTVTIPQSFLDAATYPVVVNDTFGIETIGGSHPTYGANYLLGQQGTPSSNGTCNSIVAYLEGNGARNCTAGIYDNVGNPAGLLTNGATGEEAPPVGNSWVTFTFGTSPSVIASTQYVNAIHVEENSIEFFYDAVAGQGASDNDEAYSGGGNMPTGFAWDFHPASTALDRKFSIYCNYTASGGGATGAQVITIN